MSGKPFRIKTPVWINVLNIITALLLVIYMAPYIIIAAIWSLF